MTSNDAQMDVLLRRYAGKSPGSSTTEHLDADELSAFAEGSVPDGARSRYVSHLVDCDNCRQIVSQLAISSGSVVAAEAIPAVAGSSYSWWKRLAGFLSPMTLRYAAFAMVLITVAGVVFLVTRSPRDRDLVARNDALTQPPATTAKPYSDGTSPSTGTSQAEANNKTLANQPTPSSQASPIDRIAKLDQPRSEDGLVSPPKAAKEGDSTTGFGQLAGKKAEPAVTDAAPSYAPPPPPPQVATERQQSQTREQQQQQQQQQQQSQPGLASAGARKSGPADQYKVMDKQGEYSKDGTGADDNRIVTNRAPAAKRASDEKLKGPRRDMENNSAMNRNADESRGRNSQGVVSQSPANPATEERPETRSAGGRKFRRQGNGWVDTKFKSSMPLKSIARGSSEFDDLDSGLRSIAQQLGGQVLVVWKGKAYLIK